MYSCGQESAWWTCFPKSMTFNVKCCKSWAELPPKASTRLGHVPVLFKMTFIQRFKLMPVHRVLGSTCWLHPITIFCHPTLECGYRILMKHLKLKMPTDFAALILGVLSHLLIRDWHNCGSCEAISSSLNLIADYHSPESPYSPRSQIPNASVAALAAVAIF